MNERREPADIFAADIFAAACHADRPYYYGPAARFARLGPS